MVFVVILYAPLRIGNNGKEIARGANEFLPDSRYVNVIAAMHLSHRDRLTISALTSSIVRHTMCTARAGTCANILSPSNFQNGVVFTLSNAQNGGSER